MRWLFGLAFALLVALPAQAQTTPDGARVLLVLDGSGSMWGRVGNQTKIEIARETIRTLLKDWRPQDQLGLVAYGHRRKGDCNDIEVLKPVGPVDAAKLMEQVGAISPMGMTPMTAAVKMAAEQLRTSEQATSVILVSDGVETCRADPCAVAAELKRADVKLVVHTVGFDIQDRQAVRQLECMAQATGGLALAAKDANELRGAIGRAVEAARRPPAPTPPPAPARRVEQPRPAWTLEGSARLAENDDPLVAKDGLAWTVHKVMPAGVDSDYITTSYNNRIELELVPGEYDVEAQAGAARLKARVKIEAGRMTRHDVVLNAGRVGLRAKRTATENQTGEVFWEVVSQSTSETVFNSFDPETSTIVPAGKYTVMLTLGAAKLQREIEVTAGGATAVEIIAGVGRINGKILFAPGGPMVRDPLVEIYAGAQPVDNEVSITNAWGPEPKFDLPAGAHRMRVQTDGVDRTFPFEIEAGKAVAREFALDAGILAVEAPAGVDVVDIKARERGIYGDRTDVRQLTPPVPAYAMPVGKYVAVAGDKEVEFEITAGQRTAIRMPQ